MELNLSKNTSVFLECPQRNPKGKLTPLPLFPSNSLASSSFAKAQDDSGASLLKRTCGCDCSQGAESAKRGSPFAISIAANFNDHWYLPCVWTSFFKQRLRMLSNVALLNATHHKVIKLREKKHNSSQFSCTSNRILMKLALMKPTYDIFENCSPQT